MTHMPQGPDRPLMHRRASPAAGTLLSMMKNLSILALVSAIAATGCTRTAAVDTAPVGAEIEVIRKDGGVVRGTLADRDERAVKVKAGATSRSVPREQIADVRVVDEAAPAAPLPAIAKFREVTLPEGTTLVVRLDSAVASDTSRVEDPLEATLADAVMAEGVEVFPAGSVVRGHVEAVQPSGKVKGRASLVLRFTSIAVAGRDERSAITARTNRLATGTRREDAATIGIPAAGGAIIGGILGGKKGAAIGTAVGAGGGAAVVLSTGGDEVRLARGATLTLALDEAVDVRVPIKSSR
jgi:hypothetical protein